MQNFKDNDTVYKVPQLAANANQYQSIVSLWYVIIRCYGKTSEEESGRNIPDTSAAIKMFWRHCRGALMLVSFIYSQWHKEITANTVCGYRKAVVTTHSAFGYSNVAGERTWQPVGPDEHKSITTALRASFYFEIPLQK